MLRWLRGAGISLVLAAILPGCMAHARGEIVYNHEVEYVDDAPARVEYYPSTYYRGQPAYLVEGRWYYRSGPRWVVFRDEPVELRDYRVRRAPAYGHSPVYGRTYAPPSQSREVRRTELRRADEHRAAERRAELRRADDRRAAEQRAELRRAEERHAAQRRADLQQAEERRDAERRAREHAEERRDARQPGADRRAEPARRSPQPRARNSRSGRTRSPRDRNDDRDERGQRND